MRQRNLAEGVLSRQHDFMAYRDRALTNWGAIVATMLAVPIGLIWAFVEIVGGTMGCEGNTGPCGPRLLPLLGGIAVIVLVAFILGRVLNRLIAVAHDRSLRRWPVA